nr:hypothetical protein [Tanacetum cinerariifolium]GEW35527.1 hypothetical protein [Tanacetum cinerariifolium]
MVSQPIPTLSVPPAGQANPTNVVTTHQAWVKAQKKIVGLMLMTMNPDIKKNLEHLVAYDMLKELKMVYVQQADQELLLTVQEFHACKQEEAQYGLKGIRKPKPGALSLYVGDGHRVGVEAIREFHLCLPSGLVLILHNCHYASSITRGIISVSRLYKDGFANRFENNNSISVSKNNLIYFNAIPRDDIYEIVMSSSNTNDNSIKKHIEKLQHDGLLDSTDIKSLEKCVSCMFGNMDFSRYGCVYLLKHKHEVFETFKVFQKEVENQLGKTIKSLRSDRGEDDQEINEPQSNINPIRRAIRTRRTPDHMCLYIDAEEHDLRDLGEPANYKPALLDPKSNKWLNAMNVEMQYMKDNKI